jgi:hypothetical protein
VIWLTRRLAASWRLLGRRVPPGKAPEKEGIAMFLTERLADRVEVSGETYLVNPAFDVILDIQALYKEEALTDRDKMEQALQMLVVSRRKLRRLSAPKKAELLNAIYDQCVNTQKRPPQRQKLPTLDFEHDGEYIYASFLLDYGIDLLEEQGRLPWKKFIALFQGLSENSKIREVMRIRSMDIPRYTGKNGREIQQIQELKSFYALPVRGGGGQDGLDRLFGALEGMAQKGGGAIG